MVFLKEFFEKVDLEKISQTTIIMKYDAEGKKLTLCKQFGSASGPRECQP